MKLEPKNIKRIQRFSNPFPRDISSRTAKKIEKGPNGRSHFSGAPTKPSQGILCAYCGPNNSHLTLTDFQGRTILSMSAGQVPLVKKSSAFAGLRLGENLGRIALDKGYTNLELQIRGFGRSRSTIHRGLRAAGLKIVKITQDLGLAHNGCRPKKKRRL